MNRMRRMFTLKVQGSFELKGRGVIASGRAICDGEPSCGPIEIVAPDGAVTSDSAVGFDHFALVEWWRQPFGVLLGSAVSIAPGSTIRGGTKSVRA
jgi:hypothetical protein